MERSSACSSCCIPMATWWCGSARMRRCARSWRAPGATRSSAGSSRAPQVELAAERHEMGMDGERPSLNAATGLPKDYDDSLARRAPACCSSLGPSCSPRSTPTRACLRRCTTTPSTGGRSRLARPDARRPRRAPRAAALRATAGAAARTICAPTSRRSSATAGSCATGTASRTTCLPAAGRASRHGVPAANGDLGDMRRADRAGRPRGDACSRSIRGRFATNGRSFVVPGRLLRDRYATRRRAAGRVRRRADEIELAFALEAA